MVKQSQRKHDSLLSVLCHPHQHPEHGLKALKKLLQCPALLDEIDESYKNYRRTIGIYQEEWSKKFETREKMQKYLKEKGIKEYRPSHMLKIYKMVKKIQKQHQWTQSPLLDMENVQEKRDIVKKLLERERKFIAKDIDLLNDAIVKIYETPKQQPESKPPQQPSKRKRETKQTKKPDQNPEQQEWNEYNKWRKSKSKERQERREQMNKVKSKLNKQKKKKKKKRGKKNVNDENRAQSENQAPKKQAKPQKSPEQSHQSNTDQPKRSKDILSEISKHDENQKPAAPEEKPVDHIVEQQPEVDLVVEDVSPFEPVGVEEEEYPRTPSPLSPPQSAPSPKLLGISNTELEKSYEEELLQQQDSDEENEMPEQPHHLKQNHFNHAGMFIPPDLYNAQVMHPPMPYMPPPMPMQMMPQSLASQQFFTMVNQQSHMMMQLQQENHGLREQMNQLSQMIGGLREQVSLLKQQQNN